MQFWRQSYPVIAIWAVAWLVWSLHCELCDCCCHSLAVSTLCLYPTLTGSFLTETATKKVKKPHVFLLRPRLIWCILPIVWDIFSGLKPFQGRCAVVFLNRMEGRHFWIRNSIIINKIWKITKNWQSQTDTVGLLTNTSNLPSYADLVIGVALSVFWTFTEYFKIMFYVDL